MTVRRCGPRMGRGIGITMRPAVFDRPGEDSTVVVFGLSNNPLLIQVVDGTFYQHPFGTDRPPPEDSIQSSPELAYDTFVRRTHED